jgi:hypothetical protein
MACSGTTFLFLLFYEFLPYEQFWGERSKLVNRGIPVLTMRREDFFHLFADTKKSALGKSALDRRNVCTSWVLWGNNNAAA